MTFQPPYRPSGRSVWLGKDLIQTDDWIVRLSPATLAEIDACVSRLRDRKAYDTRVARDEFPLTTMTDELARMRQEIATGRGFFVFRGLDKDRYSDNELGLIFRGFGAHFGSDQPAGKNFVCVGMPVLFLVVREALVLLVGNDVFQTEQLGVGL